MSQAAISSSMGQIADAGMTPVQGTGDAFNTGKPLAGFTLYEAFAIVAQSDARVKAISSLVSEGLTYTEFDSAVKDSISQAAAADKLAGFTHAADAKGRDKYGPKQNTMVQRATEMRQVFGYLKQTHAEMHAGGYLETLKAAREWLKEKGTTWDGAAKPSPEAVQATKQTAAMAEATKQAMLSVPKLPDESTGEWFARVAVKAQEIVDSEAVKASDARLEKILAGLVKAHDIADLYNIGLSLMAHAIAAEYADLSGVVADITAAVAVDAAAPV